ncbi:Tn5252, ORF 10 protein [Streptococcus pneumoniae]|nr:Tn5252, ORF 10 protein [Streptococcus pneumoniae]VQD43204.1 Tn5252, ORF 10 protein [Streptococcus pneumoniae]
MNFFWVANFNLKFGKQFRLTEAEEKQILALMRERGETNFSDFLRKSLLSSDLQKQMETWFALWQSQKLEQISRDVHEVLILAQSERQVTQEHVSILLTCVQELIQEVANTIPLSKEFREKYMR